MTIQIPGLTPQDVKLLDYMWSLDTDEELHVWINRQSPGVRTRCLTLIRLALMASIEEDESEDMDTTVAKLMLTSIGVKC
jgi:hypothetical protein